MHLENLTIDAADPARLGRFWARLLGASALTDTEDLVEVRMAVEGGPVLDLCFPRVPEPVPPAPRLHLDLHGGDRQEQVVERAIALGARHLDIGQGDVPWVVLADPEGNPFCVMEHRDTYVGSGPLAALPLDSADPERDRRFWRELSGWADDDHGPVPALRHPSGRGPVLELCPEPRPAVAGVKNRLHLDIRLGPGESADDVVAVATELGGAEIDPGWGALPWRVLHDPSGNVLCVLPAPS